MSEAESIAFEALLERARELTEAGTSWHYHFFPPECQYNDGLLYKIVVEDEEGGESIEAAFSTRPMDELAELDDLQFGRG